MGPRDIWTLLKQTLSEWNEDGVPHLAAAISYYTAFALAPVLVVVIAVAGLVFDRTQVRGEILAQMEGMLGSAGGQLVGGMLDAAGQEGRSIRALVIGLFAIVLAASGLFGELQSALNTVWEVAPRKGRGLLGTLKDRLVSFTMVIGIGFLLLVSLVLSAGLAAVGKYAGGRLPDWATLLQVANFVLGFAMTTALFAMIYKVLPDVELRWRDVWLGAAVTAALFTIGRLLIGLYLGRSSIGSAYGAAGSLAIMLLWVYYSSQILLVGAEFTQVYARWRGRWIEPRPQAEVKTDARKQTVTAPGRSSERPPGAGHGTSQPGRDEDGRHGRQPKA
jgi:membrane protein